MCSGFDCFASRDCGEAFLGLTDSAQLVVSCPSGRFVPGVNHADKCGSNQAGGDACLLGDVLGSVCPAIRWLGSEDLGRFECGLFRRQVAEPFVD